MMQSRRPVREGSTYPLAMMVFLLACLLVSACGSSGGGDPVLLSPEPLEIEYKMAGPVGGPFSGAEPSVRIKNTAETEFDYEVSGTKNWVGWTVPTTGTVPGGGELTFSLRILDTGPDGKPGAGVLGVGRHEAVVRVRDTASGSARGKIVVSLEVSGQFRARGAVGGPFIDSGSQFQIRNEMVDSRAYVISSDRPWMSWGVPTTGSVAAGSGMSMNLSVDGARAPTENGTYTASVTVDDPGAGSRLATIEVVLEVTDTLIPIARWDTVPHQRINAGETLHVGVVAFSKAGIDRVSFTVSGQGYEGVNPIEIDRMTQNPASGVWEYVCPISCSSFRSDGVFTVDAMVIGRDAGVRHAQTGGGGLGLDALEMNCNPTGALLHVEAWVDATGGNDATALVGDSSLPFATIGRAMKEIIDYREASGLGKNADGGVVRLNSGVHQCSAGGEGQFASYDCDHEWITIKPTVGGDWRDTILQGGEILKVPLIKVEGVQLLRGADTGGGLFRQDSAGVQRAELWLHECELRGHDRYAAHHSVTGEYGRMYYTDCAVTKMRRGVAGSPAIVRGCTFKEIGDDVFQNVPLVVNCAADDIDPGTTGWHADAWQHWGGNAANRRDDNVIVYNYRVTNCKYQGIFIRPDIKTQPAPAHGMAFVNVYIGQAASGCGWARGVSHLLFWHCTFDLRGDTTSARFNWYAGQDDTGTQMSPRITDLSLVGCCFSEMLVTLAIEVDWQGTHQNHYGTFVNDHSIRGSGFTLGDAGLGASGAPLESSVLRDRVDPPPVPVDLAGSGRGGRGDIGAYNYAK